MNKDARKQRSGESTNLFIFIEERWQSLAVDGPSSSAISKCIRNGPRRRNDVVGPWKIRWGPKWMQVRGPRTNGATILNGLWFLDKSEGNRIGLVVQTPPYSPVPAGTVGHAMNKEPKDVQLYKEPKDCTHDS
uniref:Uncharacterized protein n=1 Tax=Sorghum bicolor TaxID=4558 RepID=Q9XE74_SORBI|nr:hypothetical protein [Sorghum bicolor]